MAFLLPTRLPSRVTRVAVRRPFYGLKILVAFCGDLFHAAKKFLFKISTEMVLTAAGVAALGVSY